MFSQKIKDLFSSFFYVYENPNFPEIDETVKNLKRSFILAQMTESICPTSLGYSHPLSFGMPRSEPHGSPYGTRF
jgi:hypothetical protein